MKLSRKELLKIAIQNNKTMSERLKNISLGIVEPQTEDIRSKQEKMNDEKYIWQDFRNKVYELFDNDVKFSEIFIDTFNDENINFDDFDVVYDHLHKLYKNKLVHPTRVIDTTLKLIESFILSGNASGKVVVVDSNDTSNNNDVSFEDIDDEINDYTVEYQTLIQSVLDDQLLSITTANQIGDKFDKVIGNVEVILANKEDYLKSVSNVANTVHNKLKRNAYAVKKSEYDKVMFLKKELESKEKIINSKKKKK